MKKKYSTVAHISIVSQKPFGDLLDRNPSFEIASKIRSELIFTFDSNDNQTSTSGGALHRPSDAAYAHDPEHASTNSASSCNAENSTAAKDARDPKHEYTYRVSICSRPTPLFVSYEYVRETVPAIWDESLSAKTIPTGTSSSHGPDDREEDWVFIEKNDIQTHNAHVHGNEEEKKEEGDHHHHVPAFDYIIHLGAGFPGEYQIETIAWSKGYGGLDVDGKPGPSPARNPETGRPLDDGERLETKLPVADIVEHVKRRARDQLRDDEDDDAMKIKIKTSRDAGRYLCEYIFYNSLRAGVTRLGPELGTSKSLFVHVPREYDDEWIQRGVRVLEWIIEGLVTQLARKEGCNMD
ncbi:hypothetical protein L228DRAFT_244134 [Xylona heveae TC161]|uniref:Peptidase C15, pyroglutamyl peptidase I-like protein n=1 Tax=Xylona heveae (strain CBS 132557 / TC161) TaxID=1328760 RepID=A0A165ISJ3_XYLHT|nr:hypothetical protein L228DRAFT_244134 [Xylona heveae TC161]KZF25323.1 hypothetical protein L228DRAFT_244134 [Xylona heveae TC161]